MAIRVCWKLHLSLNFLEMSYHSAIVDRIFTKFSIIVLQQPLAIYDTAFNKILYRKFKDWKDLLLNSVELVKISHCIQLDWSQQVFLGDEIRSEIWSSIRSLLCCYWSILSRFYFSPILLFSLCGIFCHRDPSIHATTLQVCCVSHFELLNEWTFEVLNFRMLDETCWNVGWKCKNENVGFHPTAEILPKILFHTNVKCWMKCWIHFRQP